ncbi:MAG: PKD domain-containing protein [Bacteroidales bacterium]|nr:PKD domain-containing protein [Bacteroidales bacterium]MBN2750824.1 PKD domain-containing protein [Bacteroidales bacterium]
MKSSLLRFLVNVAFVVIAVGVNLMLSSTTVAQTYEIELVEPQYVISVNNLPPFSIAIKKGASVEVLNPDGQEIQLSPSGTIRVLNAPGGAEVAPQTILTEGMVLEANFANGEQIREYAIKLGPTVVSLSGIVKGLDYEYIYGFSSGKVSELLADIEVDGGLGTKAVYLNESLTSLADPFSSLTNNMYFVATGVNGVQIKYRTELSYPQTNINFYAQYPNGEWACGGDTIRIENYSTIPLGSTAEWIMDGMLIHTGFNLPTITALPSFSHLSLQVYNAQGGYVGGYEQQLNIQGSSLSFTVSTGEQACPNSEVFLFTDDEYTTLEWEFNGEIIKDKNYISHKFAAGTYPITLRIQFTNCPSDTIVKQLEVTPAAVPAVIVESKYTELCPNDEAVFEIGDTWGGDYTFAWELSDGTTSTERTLKHAFITAGAHWARLTATNGCGGFNSDTAYIQINSNLKASAGFEYQVATYSICQNEPVVFRTHNPGDVIWAFGDGATAEGREVIHYFTELNGTYDVKAMLTNGCGNSAVETMQVNVNTDAASNPVENTLARIKSPAGELIDTIYIVSGSSVTFVNMSPYVQGNTFKWTTYPGDSIATSSREYQHTFPDTMTYQQEFNVYLVQKNPCGSKQTSRVTVVASPYLIPNVDLNIIPDTLCVGDPLYVLDNKGMRQYPNISYNINFSDGTTLTNHTNFFDIEKGIVASHTYATEGVYPVYITAAAENETTGQFMKEVYVVNNADRTPFYYTANTTFPSKSPNELYYFEILISGTPDTIIYFGISDLYAPKGNFEIYKEPIGMGKYLIDIGTFARAKNEITFTSFDGSSCAYASKGTYNITFAPGFYGVNFAIVNEACPVREAALTNQGNFMFSEFKDNGNERAACVGDKVFFEFLGGIPNKWVMDDGNELGAAANAEYAYSTPGFYNVFAQVTNGCGRVDSIYTSVEVGINGSKPTGNFFISSLSIKAGESISFTYEPENSTYLNAAVRWDFGDGTAISTERIALHTYTKAGKYQVSFEATNGCGTTYEEREIVVEPVITASPKAVVPSNEIRVASGAIVELDASLSLSSTGTTSGIAYQWSAPAELALSSTTTAVTSFTAPVVEGERNFIAKVTVTEGSLTSSNFVNVIVSEVVVANAGPDQSVYEQSAVTFDGSGSSGYNLTYKWYFLGAYSPFATSTNPIVEHTIPTVKKDTTIKVRLEVTNEFGVFENDTLALEVLNLLNLPIYVIEYGDAFTANGTYNAPYTNLDSAFNNSSAGDTIYLFPGYHTRAYSANNQLKAVRWPLTIIGIEGERNTTVTNPWDHMGGIISFDFTQTPEISGNIRISGLRIEPQGSYVYGVNVQGALNVNVTLEKSYILGGVSYENILLTKLNQVILRGNVSHPSATGSLISECTNVTSVNNTFGVGGLTINSSLQSTITNTAFYGATTGLTANYSGNVFVKYSGFFNCTTDTLTSSLANITFGEGVLKGIDPLFADPVYGNYSPLAGSPYINTGDPNPAYNNQDGTRSDIGAIPYISAYQRIPLAAGWNIIASFIDAENPNMQALFNDIIQRNNLIKVQDQHGLALEEVEGTWINGIGNFDVRRGYLVKVSANDTLIMTGSPVVMGRNIDLNTGWNLAGYHSKDIENALDVMWPLVENGSLEKIQSENGASVENLPEIGWVNRIGNFHPGEGYRLRMAFSTVFSPEGNTPETTKKATAHTPTSTVFTRSWVGYGYNHMNIYLTSATFNGEKLKGGDQIGLFDGEICVGTYTVLHNATYPLALVATADDPFTAEKDGFSQNNQITAKIWRASLETMSEEAELTLNSNYNKAFTASGIAIGALKATSTVTGLPNTTLFATKLAGAYPNPFSSSVKIQFSVEEATNVTIEVYSLVGSKVAILTNKVYPTGEHDVMWDRAAFSQNRVPAGIYFVRMRTGKYTGSIRVVAVD